MNSSSNRCGNEYGIQVYGADINPAPRCPCVLLLDNSASMSGEPIAELNGGVQTFFSELLQDDFARFSSEVAIVTFGNGRQAVDLALPFTPCTDIVSVGVPQFRAGGSTPMGEAIHMGMDQLNRRIEEYRRKGISYYQPWMVMLSDGGPTDEWRAAAQWVHDQSANRKLVFICVGIGNRVDMPLLSLICPPNRPPKRLQGLKFAAFFEWLSQSMGAVSRSSVGDGRVNLPPVDGWAAV